VAAHNHYAGFGSASANFFRKMVGLNEVVWEELKQKNIVTYVFEDQERRRRRAMIA
jgi:hypothetical protein